MTCRGLAGWLAGGLAAGAPIYVETEGARTSIYTYFKCPKTCRDGGNADLRVNTGHEHLAEKAGTKCTCPPAAFLSNNLYTWSIEILYDDILDVALIILRDHPDLIPTTILCISELL